MNPAWRVASFLSQPLLVITYGMLFMLLSNPILFGGPTLKSQLPFVWIVLFSTFVIPLLAIVMMRRLHMITSFDLRDRKERVGPLFATCVLYSAFYFNVKQSNTMPEPFGVFLLGALVSLFLCLFVNSFYKVSLQAVGAASLLMGMFIFYFSGQADIISFSWGVQTISINFILVPMLVLVLMGAVATRHVHSKLYRLEAILSGWMVGIVGHVFALLFL